MLAVGNDRLWQQFCEVAGRADLGQQPGFATSADRVINREAVIDRVSEIMRERTTAEWMRVLEGAGIPAGPINTVAEALGDPHVLARDMAVDLEHPTIGKVGMTGVPVKFSATPGEVRTAPPLLGEHTEEVLRALGYSENDVVALRARGVV
jgi:formyl-CoA transferase/CoA:oxalate CoA-transferase